MEIIKPRETVGGREGEEVVEEKGDCGHREGPARPQNRTLAWVTCQDAPFGGKTTCHVCRRRLLLSSLIS